MVTGTSAVAAISERVIHPYSDMLLHDMGPELDDGYTEGSATSAEWRTPPLWGLGLAADSQGGSTFLLHDGRARSVAEAVSLHGGEGEASMQAFSQLSPEARRDLLMFLDSL